MKSDELKEEINIELELIERILLELSLLQKDVADREPSVREKTAASAFIAQFYGGVENILKRINYFYNVPLPTGDTWHIDLFKRFCEPPHKPLPVLFSKTLELLMAPYRKFRHVVYHGYGFQLEWSRMKEGLENIDEVFSLFKAKLIEFLQTL